MIDLHTHTNASDGILSPARLVSTAVKCGVRILSITDHDTISGIDEARAEARNYALDFIPGIELSADVARDEVHILGYFIDLGTPEFLAALEEMRKNRISRIAGILEKLEALNVNPGIELVMKHSCGESVGRPHVARAMMEAGFVRTQNEAFQKYLSRDGPGYIPRKKIKPERAVKLILNARGIPVLAHPGLIGNFSEIFELLLNAGLMGIESYYPKHSPEKISYFNMIARKHDLLITAGTDYHGKSPGKGLSPGYPGVPGEVISEIQKVFKKRITAVIGKD